MVTDLFVGIPVSDFDLAVEWYERLLGAPPAFFPHDTEAVWGLAEHRYLYVVLDPPRAGHGLVLAFVDDLDGWVSSIGSRGIAPAGEQTHGEGVRKVTFRDADGNEVSLGGAPHS